MTSQRLYAGVALGVVFLLVVGIVALRSPGALPYLTPILAAGGAFIVRLIGPTNT